MTDERFIGWLKAVRPDAVQAYKELIVDGDEYYLADQFGWKNPCHHLYHRLLHLKNPSDEIDDYWDPIAKDLFKFYTNFENFIK